MGGLYIIHKMEFYIFNSSSFPRQLELLASIVAEERFLRSWQMVSHVATTCYQLLVAMLTYFATIHKP